MKISNFLVVAGILFLNVLPISAFATVSDDYGVTAKTYCPRLTTMIQRGARDASTNRQVTELQKFLSDYFDIDQGVLVTGSFGRITQGYVIRYQTENGLPAFGIVGQMTRTAIASHCKANEGIPVISTTAPAGISVLGMKKYTDANFGFSFWYPSTWTLSDYSEVGKGMFAGTTDSAGNVSAGRIILRGAGIEFDIDKIVSDARTYNVNQGACGYCGPVRYYFDANLHQWMKQYPQGMNGAPDATAAAIEQSKIPVAANISNNTMGGLHIFSTEQKTNASIIPLSARHFVIVGEYSGTNPGSGIEAPLVNTIVATDPSVATPVSIEEQRKIIQIEANKYLAL